MKTQAAEHPSARTLGTPRIVFLIIAAAAPIAAMVGNVPLALARGNGIGLPVAFLLAGLVLICFALGYGAMNARVVGSGVFYVYITRVLGRHAGGAAAYVSLLSYSVLSIGLAVAFGYFTTLVMAELGIRLPWWAYTAAALALTAFLGYRSLDISSKILGVLMVLEFAVLLAFDGLVVGQRGTAAFPAPSFFPEHVFTLTLGVAAMFAFISFTGFESAALYGEEAKNPAKSVPQSTMIAVLVSAGFYFLTSWVIVGAIGIEQVPQLASASTDDLGELVLNLMQQYGGEGLQSVAAVLLCTSIFASYLALHNAATRYLFLLGRERMLPERLGDYHPYHLSPHIASLSISLVSMALVAVLALLGSDPYASALPALLGLGTLGIILIQAVTALTVVMFFLARREGGILRTLVAPIIGFAGLSASFFLAAINYATLAGSRKPIILAEPWLLAVAAVAGALMIERLRRASPTQFVAFGSSELRSRQTTQRQSVPTYSRRYCLVGAGPAGMVMARALRDEGVPFDWFEKHSAFGGIWDIEREGTPMYRSVHFISSKYTSGFYGQPMPSDFPDYPGWRQIRDYIRGFGRDWGLEALVNFGIAVNQAELQDDGSWQVTTSDGQTRRYDGLIACPGVTWHPNRPQLPGEESFTGEIRHSNTYFEASEFANKRVLIVGAGNSGVDIACDAASTAERAFISLRRGYHFFPKHIAGIPTDAILTGKLAPPKGIALSTDPRRIMAQLVGDLTRLGLPKPDHEPLESHPIMNTQVLHALSHGDLIAKGDIERLEGGYVLFKDGSREPIDLVLLATGYEYRLPFLDESLLEWNHGHPQLTLRVFPKGIDSLALLGLIEFADAAYKRFDEMAQLVMLDIYTREVGGPLRDDFLKIKNGPQPDLSGGHRYIDSPRHANYVDSNVFRRYLAVIRDRFGWPDPSEDSYRRPTQQSAGTPE